jgi:hypothetical protein
MDKDERMEKIMDREVEIMNKETIEIISPETIHDLAVEKGWWDKGERNFGELMILFVSEISEAFEDYRIGRKINDLYYDEKNKPCGIPSELADLYIRLADLCGYYDIDLAEAVRIKHEYNKTRSYRHGNKKA